jgi:hypothetical protein
VDTAQSKFGGASLLCDDDTDDYLSIADSDDWNFGSGDFTLDFRVRFAAVGKSHGFIQQYVDVDNRAGIVYSYTDGGILYYVRSGGSPLILVKGTWSPSAATWYHIELARSTNDWRISVDGSLLSMTGTPDSDSVPDLAAALWIGRYGSSSDIYLDGWMDEIRVSKGIARHTSNFTPPTSEYARFGDPEYLRRQAYPIDRVPPHAVVW